MPAKEQLLERLLHVYGNDMNSVRQALSGIKGNTYKKGGGIHIKPENRGKFTALKERTGHSASWFKAHGTLAQKRMAVFELNARKWKHSDGGLLENIAPSDATRVQPNIQPESVMIDTSPQAILNRANSVFTNYQDAPDYNISTLRDMGSLAFRKALRHYKDNVTDIIPSGLSNCTLTATQWIDPTNPIAHASTIVANPEQYGYVPVDSADTAPGDLFIARNPENDSYHTMLVEGKADDEGVHNINGNLYPYFLGETLLRYSRGGHDNSFIRRAVPMGSYMNNSDGKTERHFYRYKKNKPTDYFDNLVLPTFE